MQEHSHLGANGCQVWEGLSEDRTYGDPPKTVTWPLLGIPGRHREHVRRWIVGYVDALSGDPSDLSGYRCRLDPERTPACDPHCINPEHLLVEPRKGWT